MKTEISTVLVNGVESKVTLQFFAEEDRHTLKRLFTLWNALNKGMKLISARGINLPEGISEPTFCLDFNRNAGRALKGGSFDAYDIVEKKAIQIKASSVKHDLISNPLRIKENEVQGKTDFLGVYTNSKLQKHCGERPE